MRSTNAHPVIVGVDGTLPDERDELNRKTLEVMEWLINMRQDGQLSPSAYKFGMKMVDMTTGGLIDPEITQMIWEEVKPS